MNKEEIKFYSIGRGSLNINGKFYYGLDYPITDFMRMLEKENQELKKQLEYIRNGEYLNQLKFERNMLEDIVQNSEISKEDKEFIDMTHRNTELLEENQKLKDKIKTYEDPEDLTLMFMYCDEKAKDKIKELKDRIDKAIEYMKKWGEEPDADMYMQIKEYQEFKYLLSLLKGDKE